MSKSEQTMKRKSPSVLLILSPREVMAAYNHYSSRLPENSVNPRFFEKLGQIRKRLFNKHKRLKSWEKVAELPAYAPIPGGTLSTFVKDGYLPVKWFEHFKLPTFAQAPTCKSCGEVHTTSRCTQKKRGYKDLFSMPENILKFKIENREDY